MKVFHKSGALAVGGFCRSCSSWENGSSGFDWKSRHLREKRDVALTYLGDVKKRVPIHDSIRLKSQLGKKSISQFGEELHGIWANIRDNDSGSSPSSQIHNEIEALIGDILLSESSSDTLRHIPSFDAALLDSEFLSDTSNEAAVLQRWLKLRKSIAEFQSYASVPESERTSWSAWYLRHVKGPRE